MRIPTACDSWCCANFQGLLRCMVFFFFFSVVSASRPTDMRIFHSLFFLSFYLFNCVGSFFYFILVFFSKLNKVSLPWDAILDTCKKNEFEFNSIIQNQLIRWKLFFIYIVYLDTIFNLMWNFNMCHLSRDYLLRETFNTYYFI